MDSARMASTTSSRFLELPPELRNRIYEAAMIETGPILTHPVTGGRPDDVDHCTFIHPIQGALESSECVAWGPPALLQSCRTIRREALSIYYARNVFWMGNPDIESFPDILPRLLSWIHSLSLEARLAIRCLQIRGWIFYRDDDQGETDEDVNALFRKDVGLLTTVLSSAGLAIGHETLYMICGLVWADDGIHDACYISQWANVSNVDLAKMRREIVGDSTEEEVVCNFYADWRQRAGGRLDGDPPEAL
ncbi:hypothetical protein LTR17_011371 [Elasticomyces elasticus]|nr:hypothetical protein LTR17_011371 [Elasticomyces elasticus]